MYNLFMESIKLGDFIRHKRQELDITQGDLATQANISQGYLTRIERGIKTPSPEVINSIAKVLRVPSRTLFNLLGEDEPVKPKSRIPDLPEDPPLEPELQAIIDDPELEIYFSRSPYGGKLSNRQKRQIALNIKMMYEENEERERR